MKANVGMIDRALRIVLGITLLGLTISGLIGPWGWIGTVPLVTGMISICPLYALLHINTGAKEV